MSTKTPSNDRRKHNRFKAEDDVFASIHPQYTVRGRITDISTDGLAFCYVAGEKRTQRSSLLNISVGDGSFRLEKVPVNVIWDSPMQMESSVGNATVRNCGVQFVDLANDQKSDLERLIKNYAIPDPED